jgi:cell division protein FtsW
MSAAVVGRSSACSGAARLRAGAACTAAAPARVQGFDPPLLWVTVALLAWGLVMVYSASIAMPDNPRSAATPTPSSWCGTLFLVLSFVAGLLAFQVPVATWERVAPWLFVASLLLLVLVLVPHIGKGVNGARRWIAWAR